MANLLRELRTLKKTKKKVNYLQQKKPQQAIMIIQMFMIHITDGIPIIIHLHQVHSHQFHLHNLIPHRLIL